MQNMWVLIIYLISKMTKVILEYEITSNWDKFGQIKNY